MNQRIEELIEQATERHEIRSRETLEDYGVEVYFSKQKFAELLVQDCANWIRSNYDNESAEPLAFYMEMYYGLHGDYA
jgi:hypothetical protein